MRKIMALVLLGLVAGGCAARTVTGGESLGPGYSLFRGDWKGGSATIVALRAREEKGKLSFCGAHASIPGEDGYELDHEAYVVKMLTGAKAGIGAVWMLDSLDFVISANHGSDVKFSRRPAACIVTEIPWKERFGRDPLIFQAPSRIDSLR